MMPDLGYISVRKEFRDRKPVSWYSLRPKRRKGLIAHVQALQDLIGSIPR